ncbi:MAG: phosphoribosylformylglycinamidine cyclo-ligase [Patescibacteria group bacterium]|nr:phosphoribosylformylglycinamidine cyclo-ligase [Patescibacteria group bacterium]MDD4610585.1 phosphoribosylformylglycinamidine cyclo-ligase [Patescibacteria group bacterium]
MKRRMTYADAGVDVEKAEGTISEVRGLAASTLIPGAGAIGGFGAAFDLLAGGMEGMRRPILLTSTDGVGTKLKIAFAMNKHDTVGIDLVAMAADDVAVQGAQLLLFLDYFATGKLETGVMLEVIKGIAEGCRQAGCALIGGETAEMPDAYPAGEYDLAGFAVGIVDKDKMIDGSRIIAGHQLIGIASSGLHSNGYSLVRKVAAKKKIGIDGYISELDKTWGEELLIPTKIYARTILNLIGVVKVFGIAHVTGGGPIRNIPRILPDGLRAVIKRKSWVIPPVFSLIQKLGQISEHEMMCTFNNGIGLVVAVREEDVDCALAFLKGHGEQAFHIGEVKKLGRLKNRACLIN